ncbi:hypothetical protein [Corynebacterium timonense]|uniref:Tryptophan-associated transmembrane protein (Trp_oprn_chp) n=1 Tax=Corynebacterium timonense TaxID=441500 RepID=A0A1H1N9B7_9CORY|nr:hypothetical protein [Corynebacterium timonense]SDR95566.1 hypothetical protein SAMN04488539_0715 [Corynebacterium timonense]
MATTADNAGDLATQEKDASTRLDLGASRWVLLACAVVFLIALFLPFAGEASGWQFLAVTDAATQVQATLTELIFVWLGVLGVVVLTPLTLLTRRFAIAAPGWMVTTVALFISLLAIWLRRTSATIAEEYSHGTGIYLAIVAVAVAVFAYIPVVVGRSAQQAEAAARRAASEELDEVAAAQREAGVSTGRENPLLIDDRRARAAERHRRLDE